MKRPSTESPRIRVARLILLGNIFIYVVGIVLSGIVIYSRLQENPNYQPVWAYPILLIMQLVSSLVALRWVKQHLRRAMWSYAVVGAFSLSAMLAHDAIVIGSTNMPLLIAMFHVSVFAMGMVLGLRDALMYATLVSILSIVLGSLYGNFGAIYASIAIAYAMTLPSWLVEQMEAELRKSEEKFGVIVQESLDVILIVDCETDKILHVNEAANSILGYRRDQLLGQTFVSICAPSFDEETLDLLLKFTDTATVFEARKFLRADGSTCPMDVTATRIPWGDQQMTLVTLRDVTDREAAERELRRHREQLEDLVEQRTAALEARNEELDAFAHTVAHDLKSPLTRLIGASTILRRSYDSLSTEKRLYYLEAIEKVGYQMSSIVEALLFMANVRSLDAVTLVPLDMKVLVESVEERLSHLIEEHDVEVIKPRQWPQAIGYAPWIREIWANYLSNAIKYGGTPPKVELGYQIEAGANRVRFWVRDNGVGLTDDQIEKLFVPFSRIEQARAEGNGLGLSIVRRIVEKLGGNVEVESTLGEGSTFSFSLPTIHHVKDSQHN